MINRAATSTIITYTATKLIKHAATRPLLLPFYGVVARVIAPSPARPPLPQLLLITNVGYALSKISITRHLNALGVDTLHTDEVSALSSLDGGSTLRRSRSRSTPIPNPRLRLEPDP